MYIRLHIYVCIYVCLFVYIFLYIYTMSHILKRSRTLNTESPILKLNYYNYNILNISTAANDLLFAFFFSIFKCCRLCHRSCKHPIWTSFVGVESPVFISVIVTLRHAGTSTNTTCLKALCSLNVKMWEQHTLLLLLLVGICSVHWCACIHCSRCYAKRFIPVYVCVIIHHI